MSILSLAIQAALAVTPTPIPPAAATAYDSVDTLPGVVVEAEAESDHYVQGPFLPDVQGGKINIGKKTTVVDLDAIPRISGSNYRLALIQAPGLILSEESSPLLSIGYRGLEPHRTQYTQVLVDGIPIHADQFGYPEAYYVPPLDTVDRIEFIRGGASLMYGPQPGGALNYVTHRPSFAHTLGGSTINTFGADSTWNNFTYIDGTSGRFGYYVYYNHRETDGFRQANSDVELDAGFVKLALDADGPRRWFLTLGSYREAHGEPGGLSRGTGANDLNFDRDPDQSSRLNDRFELDRDAATLTLEQDFEHGQFSARAWVVDYTRFSNRERGGGFGTRPTGAIANSFDAEAQTFDTWGVDARYRRNWGVDDQHSLSVGAQYFRTDSPRTDSRDGVLRIASQRDIEYLPVFAESLFRFGRFSITPGVRIENVKQTVTTSFVTPVAAPRSREIDETVALYGIGSTWDFSPAVRGYLNYSESYRPAIFTEAVPNSTATIVAGDLEEGSSWQTDVGLRAQLDSGLIFDTSVFLSKFEDKIGGAGTAADPVRNIGEIEYRGLEVAGQYDVLNAGSNADAPQLNLLLNFTILDAEITADSNPQRVGNAPQYAPDYLVRSGLVYRQGERRKLALLGTFVDQSFADDANTATRLMPSYQVWDLTGEWQLGASRFTLLGGITNLLDEKYTARIRNDGIDPAAGRTWYAGLQLDF
ncbi:MAG: TonB-dependent receptor family protein [Pseudomarimonas sp.]